VSIPEDCEINQKYDYGSCHERHLWQLLLLWRARQPITTSSNAERAIVLEFF